VRDDVPQGEAHALNDAIRRSLAFARANEAAVMPYVREHAFEMDEAVMRQHIALYVNNYSDDVTETGVAAANELFTRAQKTGILKTNATARFIDF
jgi:1,4-dihydroxy-6-naphthoate synthase